MSSNTSRRVIARTIATKLIEEPKERKRLIAMLAAYLIENNRVDETDQIVNDIAHELFVQNGDLIVDVASARPLTEQVRDELVGMLKESTGAKRVDINEAVDPSLLGGLIARTPDAQLDLTIRTKLKQLATIK